MKWGEFYKAGGAAGFSPVEVKQMSLWEFLMCVEGWKLANGVSDQDKIKPPSEDEFEAALATIGE